MSDKIEHLKLIQAVVDRMARNSFQLKAWSVTLVSAMFALAAGSSRQAFVYLAYFPAVAFWVLDGYFLWQERLFRTLYDQVREVDDSKIDFSMDTSSQGGAKRTWARAFLSTTLVVFHGTILLSILLVMVLTRALD